MKPLPAALLQTFGLAALVVVGAGACGGGNHARPCSEALVIDTYAGGIGDPYFYGYAGDPTFGGTVGWYDPTYYDPSYDPSYEGDGIEDQSPTGTEDSSTEDSSSSDNAGDDSSGTSSQSFHLHPTSGELLVGGACATCTLACTFATPGGDVPVGDVGVGEDGESVDAACIEAMLAIERAANGAALSRCRQVDPDGLVPASPSVALPGADAGAADAGSAGAGPSEGGPADLGPGGRDAGTG